MLSAFPQLFTYSPLAIAGLRIVFGIWFLAYAYTILFRKETQVTPLLAWLQKGIAGISLIVGICTILGAFTQIALLLGLLALIVTWYVDVRSGTLTRTVFEFGFYIAIIGIALIFLGPGAFAIDYPL